MITNSGMTIYNELPDGSFKRTYIHKTFWRNVKAEQTKKYGADNASTVTVIVFFDGLDGYAPAENYAGTGWTASTEAPTYIVNGESMTDTGSIDDVYAAYPGKVFKVCSVTENMYGSNYLWHIAIEGK